jgi:hypothetical protein
VIEHGKTYGTARTELANARDATMFEKCMVISSIRMLDVRREMFQRLSARYIYCGSSSMPPPCILLLINRVGGHALAGLTTRYILPADLSHGMTEIMIRPSWTAGGSMCGTVPWHMMCTM